MKKPIVYLVLLLSIITGTASAATNETVSPKVLLAFNHEFSNASDVNWLPSKGEGIYHVKFSYNSESMEAMFNEEGKLIGTGRAINEHQLPIMALRTLNAEIGSYKIREIFEVTTENETAYLTTLFNEKEILVLKLYPGGDSQRVKKIKYSK